jgi:hypothetical protein
MRDCCGQSSRTVQRPTSVDNLTPNRLTASRGIDETGTSTLCVVQPVFGVLVRRPTMYVPLTRSVMDVQQGSADGRGNSGCDAPRGLIGTALSRELPRQMRTAQADQQTLHVRPGRWPSHDVCAGVEAQSMEEVSHKAAILPLHGGIPAEVGHLVAPASGWATEKIAPRPSQTGRTMNANPVEAAERTGTKQPCACACQMDSGVPCDDRMQRETVNGPSGDGSSQ